MASELRRKQVATSRYRVALKIIEALKNKPLSMTELLEVVKKNDGDRYSMKLIKVSLNRLVKHGVLSSAYVGNHITKFSIFSEKALKVDVFLPESEGIATVVRKGVTRYSGEKIAEKQAKWMKTHRKKSAYPLSVGTGRSVMADMNI